MQSGSATGVPAGGVADDGPAALWNGTAAQAWIDNQDLLDRMFEPFAARLVDTARSASARRLLDVGCGTGAATLALARALGADGHCVGVDVSAPMIEVARARARREAPSARFVLADAQSHAFEPAGFDLLVSRFGVMFFDDPVAAFANLRRAAAPGAELCAIVWRGPEDNPFMTVAAHAAAPLLPELYDLPGHRPGAPGQFGFAEPAHVRQVLGAAGWRDIGIRPLDVACRLPESGLVRYFTRLGPLGRALHRIDDATRMRIVETVRVAFDPHVHGDEVRFDAACWQVAARVADGGAGGP